ncbi:MAG TPA: hypothetical protein VGP76_16095 [Planctomycetaceae bacterium]|jgi:hypothetical protein|nr:hypothetical protein [Planctomycetaceae bacterium]
MSEYLALDWDDQRLVGVAAQVASKRVEIRAVLDFTWGEGETPSEHPEAAGKRLRAELDQISAPSGSVLVSLPREEAIVRLLELPECTDDDLPELVRFQAVTRSAVPLDKLLLDYLPLPTLKDVAGRRVWMATIGKPVADRVQAILSAAQLEAGAIRLSSLGAAELIAHQPGVALSASDPATLIVSCVDLRIEITAIWQNRIVLMHAATLSSHDPPEAQLSQILAETSRSTVALSQAAPGLQIGSGWLIGPRTEQSPLATMLTERFGFKFHVLTDPASTPGVTAANSSLAMTPLASAPLGLLLEQAAQRVDAIDFLHPRRQHPKPDRRRLYMGLGAAAAVLLLLGLWGAIQRRVWQYDDEIAKLTESNNKIKALLDKSKDLRETAGWVEDWTRRDIDWLDQFRVIEQAKNGADKLYLTSFDANVATRDKLATIVAAGRAKVPSEVDEFEDKLVELGYRVPPKEISEDTTDPQYPVKIDLNLEIVDAAPKPSAAPNSATTAKPDSGTGQPTTSQPTTSAPNSSTPSNAPRTATSPATSASPATTPPVGRPPANTRQAETGPATAQPAVSATPVPVADDAPQPTIDRESSAVKEQTAPSKN